MRSMEIIDLDVNRTHFEYDKENKRKVYLENNNKFK
jgi:hypothetical protein